MKPASFLASRRACAVRNSKDNFSPDVCHNILQDFSFVCQLHIVPIVNYGAHVQLYSSRTVAGKAQIYVHCNSIRYIGLVT